MEGPLGAEGRGKHGGVRVIYFNRLADGTVWLMTADGDWLNGMRSVLQYDDLRVVNPFAPFWFRTARTRMTSLRARHPDYASKHDWLLTVHGALLDQQVLNPA